MDDSLLNQVVSDTELIDYIDEVNSEIDKASDRGTALICSSVIEELLKELLEVFLVKSNKIDNDLFKGNGPLSTFDARKKMLYYLGIITKEDYDNLTYLQRVRNKFAHTVLGASFQNQDIINICGNFEITKDAYTPDLVPLPDSETGALPVIDLNPIKESTPARERFIFVFNHLYNILIYYMMKTIDIGRVENTLNATGVERLEYILDFNHRRTEKYSDLLKKENERLEELLSRLKEHKGSSIRGQSKTELIEQFQQQLVKNQDQLDKNLNFIHSLNKTFEYAKEVCEKSID